jgi:ribosomal protein L29
VEDSKSNADVGGLVVRIEQLEGLVDDLHQTIKAQAQALQNLRQQTAAGANAGGGLTKADLAKMSPDEINARWEEVKKTMKGGK